MSAPAAVDGVCSIPPKWLDGEELALTTANQMEVHKCV